MAQRVTLPGEKACQYITAIKGHVQSLSISQQEKKALLDAVAILSKHFNC
ncbi:MAG: hypothetical protein KME42_08550 [Tildeniella nuda ZEHNDER 1965/U140]|jgi:hypothetical protein|nr:hypothetical protein [Tildeniella nuda ZEHNDER 1965/U140]